MSTGTGIGTKETPEQFVNRMYYALDQGGTSECANAEAELAALKIANAKPGQAMTPQEIDAAVAEKVMGYTLNEDVVWIHDVRYRPGTAWKTGPDQFISDWSPSTDMNHAMEVVVRMSATHAMGATYQEPWTNPDGTSGGGASVGFGYVEDDEIYCRHKSMPMAICLAALRAVGVEVGGWSCRGR